MSDELTRRAPEIYSEISGCLVNYKPFPVYIYGSEIPLIIAEYKPVRVF